MELNIKITKSNRTLNQSWLQETANSFIQKAIFWGSQYKIRQKRYDKIKRVFYFIQKMDILVGVIFSQDFE
jgi:hypothetical protein